MPKTFLFYHYNPKSGCDLHRCVYPMRGLGEDFPDLEFELSLSDPRGDYDYVATHGCPTAGNLRHKGQWKRRGWRWVWSLDDDMLRIHPTNPWFLSDENLDCWYAGRDLADVILSSTPTLTAAVGRPEKTITAPNLMNVTDYGVDSPAPARGGEELRVLWAGSKSHKVDLDLIDDAVCELLKKWRGRAEFVFVGSAPSKSLVKYLNRGVHLEPSVPAAIYPQLMSKIRPHVVLAPLADTAFNNSKSNIRVLEAWSLAAPVVASPVGEYRVVRDGIDGLYADSPDEWFDRVDRLLSDRQLRESLGSAGRRRVADFDWASRDARRPWRDAVAELRRRL